MTKEQAVELLKATLEQYEGAREIRWQAVHNLGKKFAAVFTCREMQDIAGDATDSHTIDVVDKSWSGIKAHDGVRWLA